MNVFLIALVSFFTVTSQLLLKKALLDTGQITLMALDLKKVVQVFTNPFFLGAFTIQVLSYLLWIVVVSRVNLGVAFATSGAFFYLLIAFCSWIFFRETLSLPQSLGIVLITLGVLMMTVWSGKALP
jgi:multidrug transporter EmrE-like cation transporter